MSKNNNNNLLENVWIVRLISLLVSILLFGYVYSENYGLSTTNRNDAISTLRSETISNLPIQINMDTDRYFISGLPETVMLNISGPESVIVQTLSASDFNIVTEDLDLLGPGRHTVQLRVENLSEELTYQIVPSRVNVQIEEKVTIESSVEVRFDTDAVNDAYISKEPILNRESVIITGPASTVERIDRIYVRVPSENEITSTLKDTYVVQVEDEARNKLNVVVEPQEIEVEIPVEPYEKTVPIRLVQTGTPVSGKKYQLSLARTENVVLTGNQKLLADVDEVVVEVDVSAIRSTVAVTAAVLPLDLAGTDVVPKQVEVNVTVENTQTEETSERSNQTTNTSNNR
ncbi:YbbR-like domain-containing protein [Jeotgalibaca porci]|uniref:CdaR family protein n=1 Tax=Jeotgalibaca porci TaxID=1868793 RepID=UPI0035A197E7